MPRRGFRVASTLASNGDGLLNRICTMACLGLMMVSVTSREQLVGIDVVTKSVDSLRLNNLLYRLLIEEKEDIE
jgi:hypothetical protein